MRALRLEIADRKLTGDIAPNIRAPQSVHRTLVQVLAAIDQLDAESRSAALVLPAQQEVEEFVYHQTAVQHWADAIVAQGILTLTRPREADRFWDHLQRQAVAATE